LLFIFDQVSEYPDPEKIAGACRNPDPEKIAGACRNRPPPFVFIAEPAATGQI